MTKYQGRDRAKNTSFREKQEKADEHIKQLKKQGKNKKRRRI